MSRWRWMVRAGNAPLPTERELIDFVVREARPARRQALRRVERRSSPTTRIYWVPLVPEQADGIRPHLAPLRGQAAARAAHRAAEEPARLLAAAAEPAASTCCRRRRSSLRSRRATAQHLRAHRVPLHRVAGRRDRTSSSAPAVTTISPFDDGALLASWQKRVDLINSDAALAGGRSSSSELQRPYRLRRIHPESPRASGDAHAFPLRRGRSPPRNLRHRSRPAQPGARSPREVERLRAAYASAGYGPRPPRRPAAREPAGVLHPLARAQCPRRQHRADPRRHALGRVGLPDQPQRDRRWRSSSRDARAGLRAGGELRDGADCSTRSGPRSPAGSRRRARRRASTAQSRSAAAPSARCSTPRAPPAGPRAAASPTATSCAPASGTSASRDAGRRCVPDVERFITPLPLSHMNALAFSSMARDRCPAAVMVQLDRFHPRTWWQSVRDSARDGRRTTSA